MPIVNAANDRPSGLDQADVRFLVDKNADGIIVVDADGIVLFANPAAEQIFGRPAGQLVGSPIGIPLVASDTSEITILRPGGQTDVEIRIVDTTWNQRPALLASLRDISARKELEERVRQWAKMEAVGRLTAGIAHDFNNLLTVVLGNLESAQRQSAAAEATLMKTLQNATRGAQRAATLTERLLAFARRKPLEPRVIDINSVVLGMSELFRRTLGERIVVRTMLDPLAWRIEADPTEFEAAILNLAVNARDAMPEGGELTIETSNVELDSAYAKTNKDVAAEPYVLIAVADSGTGMTADVLSRVFEPFFTTKPDGHGTGLGLSQVYGFVKQTGGHIKVYSEPGLGTTAKLYFPKVLESGSRLQASPEEPKRLNNIPRARSGETILVVEDDEDVRNYTASSLRELGYMVFEAADAGSALDIVEREADIQLLFTDLGLPGGIDGKALADRVQSARPPLKVLITSAYAGSALIHEGRLDAGVELLGKPFSFAVLASRIRELLDRPESASKDARILVVDDEVLVRMLVVDTLGEQGLLVEEAGSFHEALAAIRDARRPLAAAIIDLGLPDRPGDELVAAIRSHRPSLPIILATGYAYDDVQRRFATDHFLKIVTKPFDPASLKGILAGFGISFLDQQGH